MNAPKICSIFIIMIISLVACQMANQAESKNQQGNINLTELTIAEIHQAYVNGTYNSQNLVEEYLSAIAEGDEAINAITFINPNARNIAKMLDEANYC